jgi:gamma-glutamyltranspeptidase/glutathione hydrolase
MGHAHLLGKLFDHRLDLQTVIDLPRLFPLLGTNIAEMEQRLRDRHGAALQARGFVVRPPNWGDWRRAGDLDRSGARDPARRV